MVSQPTLRRRARFSAPGPSRILSVMTIRAVACAGAMALAFAGACTFDAGGVASDVGHGDDRVDAGDPGNGPASDAGAPAPDADAGEDVICDAGEPICDGRVLRTCAEDGASFEPGGEECAFTCADAQCVFASNLPAEAYAACDGASRPLDPPAGATVSFERRGGNNRIECDPNCGDGEGPIEAIGSEDQDGGFPIAVFCLERLELPAGALIRDSDDHPIERALALVVDGDVHIEGRVDVGGREGGSAAQGRGGPGGWSGGSLASGDGNEGDGSCGGGGGERSGGQSGDAGGGGGGGHAGDGGDGGDGDNASGGDGGDNECASGEASPLFGGYGGGSGASGSCGSADDCGWRGGGGGGALQISARESIMVTGEARIASSGGDGQSRADLSRGGGGGGGGSGGTILLEALTIAIEGPDRLDVEGGDGGAAAAGAGGAGAAGSELDGEDGLDSNDDPQAGSGGGGGGGVVRLNAEEGASCSSASPSASCTTGDLRTSDPDEGG